MRNAGYGVIGAYSGLMRVSHTKVKWCGQSRPAAAWHGREGRYCLRASRLALPALPLRGQRDRERDREGHRRPRHA